jgi:hypothetical protein
MTLGLVQEPAWFNLSKDLSHDKHREERNHNNVMGKVPNHNFESYLSGNGSIDTGDIEGPTTCEKDHNL